jgi:hypothetical protein
MANPDHGLRARVCGPGSGAFDDELSDRDQWSTTQGDDTDEVHVLQSHALSVFADGFSAEAPVGMGRYSG